jgi:TPR repeat protein
MLRSWYSAWLLLLSFAVHAGELEDGLAAYHSKDYVQAFMRLQPLAEQGVPAAEFTLGEMYRRGRGFVPSAAEALPLLQQAAAANYLPACITLGEMFEAGEGVKQDPQAAAQWFEKAALLGDAQGELHLGVHYLRLKPGRDFQQAAVWFKRAAEQNEPEAEYFYARLLLDGKGVEQDPPAAMIWFNRASAHGHAAAQRFLYLLLQADTPDRALALRDLERNLTAGVAVLDTISADARYGFDKTRPIKTGLGFETEWQYLNALRGPKGEVVHYQRLGYCCAFDTDAAASGKGFLDQYALTYAGLAKPFILYLNMFEESRPQAPMGFSFVPVPAD